MRNDRVLLHWHPKVKAWLPPGGHIQENEDPVEAVLREVEEETGIKVEVVPTGPSMGLSYPEELPAPVTVMVEDINDPIDGFHQHIDMIYFCRPVGPWDQLNDGWRWVGKDLLLSGTPLVREDGTSVAPPEDVRLLARKAFDLVRDG